MVLVVGTTPGVEVLVEPVVLVVGTTPGVGGAGDGVTLATIPMYINRSNRF